MESQELKTYEMLIIDSDMGGPLNVMVCAKLAELCSVVAIQGTGAYCVISFCISPWNMRLGWGAGMSQMPG